jgi:hypothetical protein
MDPAELTRATILGTIVRDIPKGFWEDLAARTRQGYLDVFHQTKNDPNILAEQRLDSLYQARHFRMEHVLKTASDAHGLASSATLIATNNRRYVYASMGSVGLTQAYVQTIGEMPKAARFRERHSELNRVVSEGMLDLGIEPAELLASKDFYGLIAHNPAGKRFTENEQALGMIQLCVPVVGCGAWAAELPIQEIIAAYAAAPAEITERGPTWKVEKDDKAAK